MYASALSSCRLGLDTLSDDIDSKRLIHCVDFGRAGDVVRVIDISQSSNSSATSLFLGLTCSGTLLTATSSSSPRTLAQNANSFTISGDFVVYTTLAHEAHFVSASLLATADASTDVGDEQRRVERGSRIVTSIPSTMSLVLQMPRGNLETVNPRPMVMANIHADTDAWVFSFRDEGCTYAYGYQQGATTAKHFWRAESTVSISTSL
jgi:hypothetical protein